MSDKILCRVVIEVLGKPKEHVEKAMQSYIEKIKKDEKLKVLREEFAEVKKQESEFWATFTELEMEIEDVQNLIGFCFDYMPSVVEILNPSKIEMSDKGFSDFFSDLQARLHQVDMVAKQVKMENNSLKMNMGKLLRNYLTILLGKNALTLEQLSRFTGVTKDILGDYLDKLLDEGLVRMENEIYSLNQEKLKKKES
jgi:DNA repair exonuclease SbcCD ATPase subunit